VATTRFQRQTDPELLPALEIYRLIGLETTPLAYRTKYE